MAETVIMWSAAIIIASGAAFAVGGILVMAALVIKDTWNGHL